MRPMLAPTARGPGRGRVGARGQVGRDPGAGRRPGGAAAADQPHRARRHGGLPRAGRSRRSSRTCCSTGRSWRCRAASRRSRRWPNGSTSRAPGGPSLAARNPATLMAFDLLRLYGVDLTARSYADRRATLERLELTGAPLAGAADVHRRRARCTRPPVTRGWRASSANGSPPATTRGCAARSGSSSRTAPRPRSSSGAGVPRPTPPTASARCSSGRRPGGLRYLGRVGSGLAGKVGDALRGDLAALTQATSPFVGDVPRVDAAGATWVHPVLVCEVQALGLTRQGRLRGPAYRGLRPDLTSGDVDLTDVPRA